MITDLNAIEEFLSAHPRFTRVHVLEIAEAMRREGIPFCAVCADWHRPNEEHTEDE